MSQQVQEFQQFQDLSPTKRSILISQYFKSTITNLSYNIKNSQFISMPFLSRKTIQINQKDMRIANLLGKQYSYKAKDEFLQRFNKTIWMSYRKINNDTDVGWGCMIRVVQMVFGQAFQRYYHYDEQKVAQILTIFKDELNGCLSLSNICKKGHIQKRYTSSPQIYSIATSLLKQNKKTLLDFDLSIQNYCDYIEIKSQNQYSKDQFPKLISISTKIGQQCQSHFNGQYFPHLLNLIKDSRFCGIVGGIGNQALYIIGQYNDLAIVLDPHYVQEEQKYQTFFQKIPKGVQFTSLKPSMTINFYFENLDDFGEWVDNLMLYERLSSPYTCFKTIVKNPEIWTRNHRKKSEDFQFLI